MNRITVCGLKNIKVPVRGLRLQTGNNGWLKGAGIKMQQEGSNNITPAGRDDEISLIDVVIVLLKRKRWVLYPVIIALAISVLLAYRNGMTQLYEYSIQLELASMPILQDDSNDTQQYRDFARSRIGVQDTISKLEYGYIPSMLNEYERLHPGKSLSGIKVASSNEGGNLILLQGVGLKSEWAAYDELFRLIIDKLTEDHRQLLNAVNEQISLNLKTEETTLEKLQNPDFFKLETAEMEARLTKETNLLEKLKDPVNQELELVELDNRLKQAQSDIKTLASKYQILLAENERIDKKRELTSAKIVQLNNELLRIEKSRQELSKLGGDVSGVTAAMLADSDINRIQRNLRELNEMESITLFQQREKLLLEIDINRQESERLNRTIAQISAEKMRAKKDRAFLIEEQESVVATHKAALEKFRGTRKYEIEQQRNVVEKIRSRMMNIHNTKPLTAMIGVKMPPSRSSMTIIMLGLIAGLSAGIFLAFVAELAFKIRNYLPREAHDYNPAQARESVIDLAPGATKYHAS